MLGYFDKVEAVVSKKVAGMAGAACTVTVDNIQMMLNSAKEGNTTSIMPLATQHSSSTPSMLPVRHTLNQCHQQSRSDSGVT